MIKLIEAIHSLRPMARFSMDNDVITWDDTEQTQPTEAEITAELTRLQSAYDSNQYQRDRVLEYPSIGDQLDMIYHSGLGGPEFQAAIKAVKDAHPKGGN
jgi:hypothetical protein